MRPRRLVLANFGPYRGTAEVDFDRLGDVFLVCGKTGSGKSSIFDALTYALYGRAPESRGSLERELRSHLALPEEETRVELEFWLGQDAFRVVRTPPFRRPPKKATKAGSAVEEPAAEDGWVVSMPQTATRVRPTRTSRGSSASGRLLPIPTATSPA